MFSVYEKCIDAVYQEIISRVQSEPEWLPGLHESRVQVWDIPILTGVSSHHLPALRIGRTGEPEGFEAATNLRDDVSYVVGVWQVFAPAERGDGAGLSDRDSRNLLWRQNLRKHFSRNQSVTNRVEEAFEHEVRLGPSILPEFWQAENLIVGRLDLIVTCREPRG